MPLETGGLDAGERESWEREGFVLRTGVFAESELERLRDAIERCVESVVAHARRPGAGGEFRLGDGHRLQLSSQSVIQWEWREGSAEVRLIEPFTHLAPEFDSLWQDARFCEPSADALGQPSVSLFTSKLNLKRPREGSPFPWHQDYPYWYVRTREHAHEIVTAMLFVDAAREENGALRVLPGSHLGGPFPRDRREPTAFLADADEIDAARERIIEAEAGSLLFFPSLLLHRSAPNASPHPRRAILLSYQPPGRPRQETLPWDPARVSELP